MNVGVLVGTVGRVGVFVGVAVGVVPEGGSVVLAGFRSTTTIVCSCGVRLPVSGSVMIPLAAMTIRCVSIETLGSLLMYAPVEVPEFPHEL